MTSIRMTRRSSKRQLRMECAGWLWLQQCAVKAEKKRQVSNVVRGILNIVNLQMDAAFETQNFQKLLLSGGAGKTLLDAESDGQSLGRHRQNASREVRIKGIKYRTDNDIKNLYYSKVRAEIRRLRKELKKLGNSIILHLINSGSIFTRSKYFKLLKRAQVNVLEFSQFSTERVMELFRVLPNSKRKNFGERLKSDPTLPCLKKTNYVDTPAQSNLKERIEGYEKIDQKVVYFILKLFIESIFRRAEVASYLSLARIKQGMCFRAPAFSVAKS
eukprot:TRINITY_DN988_c0_g1_i2.p1 TRINITY_DN988_c0_g1~~TRINITY_DN988_c0_g1_i2.p1  ORF type:complete len:273 (+),score=16.25 TRINITY_DN988_c0_g1_i2:340-1158(+)